MRTLQVGTTEQVDVQSQGRLLCEPCANTAVSETKSRNEQISVMRETTEPSVIAATPTTEARNCLWLELLRFVATALRKSEIDHFPVAHAGGIPCLRQWAASCLGRPGLRNRNRDSWSIGDFQVLRL